MTENKDLAFAIGLLIEALDNKEDRYEHSCCADEIIGLVYEGKDIVVRYDEGELHFIMESE
tara:strand:- start:260 stop:442 length:183 start_codon:yes stop_codon:yes gene_type:complete